MGIRGSSWNQEPCYRFSALHFRICNTLISDEIFVPSITNTNLRNISPNWSIFFSISRPCLFYFDESVRRGDLKKKEKPFPNRTRFNFKIRVHWTLGDPKGGSAPLPRPKKKEGEKEGSLSNNWPLWEWNIYDRRTHSAFKIRSSASLKMKLAYHDHFNNYWPYKIPYQDRILSSLDDVLSLACSNLPLTKMARKMGPLIKEWWKELPGKKVVTSQES